MSNEIVKPTHAVLYTDGGCDNPAVAGWGVHGYFFTPEAAKQGTGNPKAIPTDFGYEMGMSGTPSITLTHYVEAFGSLTQNATNNSAEVSAALNAMKIVKEHGIVDVSFRMDSQYAMNGLDKWMYDWKKTDWLKNGAPVSNVDLWKQAYDLKTELTEAGVTFRSKWVKGHSGELGNERADALATAGKMAARNRVPQESVRLHPAKGFWKPKGDRNRMLSLPNWYFAAFGEDTVGGDEQGGEGKRHVYYIGTIRDSIELSGKAIADASFAVVYTQERDEVLRAVKEGTQDLHTGRPQGVMVAYLDHIFKPAVYDELSSFGRDLLIRDRRQRRLMSKDKKLILHEIDPPGLSFRLIDHLGFLEDRLRQYLNGGPSHLRLTDLTDILYEKTESKSKESVKLKGTITTGTRSLKVEGNYRSGKGEEAKTSFLLTLAQDLPDRNTLSALAVSGVKVNLLTWLESDHAVRFAVVIEANGDVGIWAGPYSNLQILPFLKP